MLSSGDSGRVFGRFTWGAYSPAGNLERHGFFWRQVKRRKPGDPLRIIAFGLWGIRMFAVAAFVITLVWWIVR